MGGWGPGRYRLASSLSGSEGLKPSSSLKNKLSPRKRGRHGRRPGVLTAKVTFQGRAGSSPRRTRWDPGQGTCPASSTCSLSGGAPEAWLGHRSCPSDYQPRPLAVVSWAQVWTLRHLRGHLQRRTPHPELADPSSAHPRAESHKARGRGC